MSEPTLSLAYADLKAEVGYYLGYTATEANWDASQAADVERAVQEGYRRYLTPPALDKTGSHDWSWRWVLRDLPIVAGTYEYQLWDDFAGLHGTIFYVPSDLSWVDITIVPAATIRRRLQFATLVLARPNMAAIEALANDGTEAQKWQLLIYPVPFTNFTFRLRYKSNRDKLSDAAPYPLGGGAFAELLRESCLAAAERMCDDQNGVHNQTFMQMLQSAITEDMRNTEPDNLGYNGDNSDKDFRAPFFRELLIQYGGQPALPT